MVVNGADETIGGGPQGVDGTRSLDAFIIQLAVTHAVAPRNVGPGTQK